MNKRQKEVLQAQLNSEEEVIAQLKSVYEQALRDCEAKIQELSMRADLEPENLKSIIYQKQYQEAAAGRRKRYSGCQAAIGWSCDE